MMKTESKTKKSKKNSRSLMLKILDWFGFRLKLATGVYARHLDSRKWQLAWKRSTGHIVFFVRHYDVRPFRRYESHFSLEKKNKTKPKESLGSCFAEFLGSVEVFELEGRLEDGWWTKSLDNDGWLKNPLFGCKSLEEMAIKLDLLDASLDGKVACSD